MAECKLSALRIWIHLVNARPAMRFIDTVQSPHRSGVEQAKVRICLTRRSEGNYDINRSQAQKEGIEAAQLAYHTQLAEPELVFRSISFVNFVSTWVIRSIDPRHQHPKTPPEYAPFPLAF